MRESESFSRAEQCDLPLDSLESGVSTSRSKDWKRIELDLHFGSTFHFPSFCYLYFDDEFGTWISDCDVYYGD